MDVSSLSSENDGVKFLLVTVDIFSKYLYLQPLQSKKGVEVKKFLENIFDKGRQPKVCRFDMGKEFSNKVVEKFLKEKNIFVTQMRPKLIL